MANAMSILAQTVRKSNATGGGELILDGDYVFTVLDLKSGTGYKGARFVAELLVESATPKGEVEGPNGATIKNPPCNAVGSKPGFVVMLSNESAGGNIKAFFMALDGCSEVEFDKAMDAGVDPANGITTNLVDYAIESRCFRGAQIRCSTFRKWSQGKGGKPKTLLCLPKWEHIDQTQEQIAARRAKLDAVPATALPPTNGAQTQTQASA